MKSVFSWKKALKTLLLVKFFKISEGNYIYKHYNK